MSELKGMLILSPPELGIVKEERIEGKTSCDCPQCHGNGWCWNFDYIREPVKENCPVCDGSGKLKPIITIEWEPDL